MQQLLKEIRSCTFCEEHLPLGANPIVDFNKNSKIVLISQAPGRVVHQSHIHWSDKSGKKLREWLGVDHKTFYNPDNFAVVPMAFCYPGKAKSGDAPPRKECAPLWHKTVFSELKNVQLKILIGAYAASYYLPGKSNLTQKVGDYEQYLPEFWCLPHPSPVNQFWRKKNPWFEESAVPKLQKYISEILKE